jgi:hypothetical protein
MEPHHFKTGIYFSPVPKSFLNLTLDSFSDSSITGEIAINGTNNTQPQLKVI